MKKCTLTSVLQTFRWISENLYTELEKRKFKVLARPRTALNKYIRKNKFWVLMAAPIVMFLLYLVGLGNILLWTGLASMPVLLKAFISYLTVFMVAIVARVWYVDCVREDNG